MIAQNRHPPWLRRLTFALLLIAALVLLWRFRPGAPLLPRSLSAPLTVEAIEGLAVWLLWLVAGLLAVAFLAKMLRTHPRPPGVSGDRWSRVAGSARSSVDGRMARVSPPRLVIPDGAAAAREDWPARAASTAPENGASVRPRVCVLGPLTINGAKRSRRGLRTSALELVAYLALHQRPVGRDELLEAFWPGQDPKRTRPRFRQAVRDARRLLGSAIASERDSYWLDRDEVDVDVDQLEALLAAANSGGADDVQPLLERALTLFTGEPFSGSDYAWSEGELRRLRATHVDLLARVGRGRLAAGEPRAALGAAERGLEFDRLNEGLWRLALEAEGALGLRDAVAQRYERLRALLDERLGLEPAQETRLLLRRLLAQG
jgi:DNA-binding SARP family transcriptional activator